MAVIVFPTNSVLLYDGVEHSTTPNMAWCTIPDRLSEPLNSNLSYLRPFLSLTSWMSPIPTISNKISARFAMTMTRSRLATISLPVAALLASMGTATSFPAFALSLTEAVALAKTTDPAFLSANADYLGAKKRKSQALAQLLPQLSVTAGISRSEREYTVENDESPSDEEYYSRNDAHLHLTQVIWNHGHFIGFSQSKKQLSQAEHLLAAAEQDLLIRLAQAWFDLMAAQDAIAFAEQQARMTDYQLAQATRGVSVGTVSAPFLEEIRAKHNEALAEQAAAEADRHVALSALEQIVGPVANAFPVPSLSAEFKATLVSERNIETWLALAESQNPSILAAQQAFEAAADDVRKQWAGHEPTLELVGKYGRIEQTAGESPGQFGYDSTEGTVGLQLNFPLFSGGGQHARVGEAETVKEKARQELESALRNARASCKQAWFQRAAGDARHEAAVQRVRFSTIAFQSAKSGVTKGLKSELDVLHEAQQFAAAMRDLRKSRYDLIMNQLKLKAVTGQLTIHDLAAIRFENQGNIAGMMPSSVAVLDSAVGNGSESTRIDHSSPSKTGQP